MSQFRNPSAMPSPQPAVAVEAAAVRLVSATKKYGRGRGVLALDDVTLTCPVGTFTAVMGPSGSGKSTLLQCAAGLDRLTSGSVLIGDLRIDSLRERALTRLRRERLGFVFQAFNLLPTLTAVQNVALPLRLAGARDAQERAQRALIAVGLEQRSRHRPGELSGGQQQRVAIARALVTEPAVVFADEPTGALDSSTARTVLDLLRGVATAGQTIMMVTHEPVAASYADRVVFLSDGMIVGHLENPTPEAVATSMTRIETSAMEGRRHA